MVQMPAERVNTRIVNMKPRTLINVMIIIIVPAAWIYMITNMQNTTLADGGIRTLRYFTILSNFGGVFASIYFLFSGEKNREKAEIYKYIAAVCLTLTLTTVLVFLGPLFGYKLMFTGASFWFHLIVPAAAILEYIFLSTGKTSAKTNLLAVVPMIIYGLFYLGNLIINGYGDPAHSNDWYGFGRWGIPFGFVIFFIVAAVTWGLGYILRKLRNKYGK